MCQSGKSRATITGEPDSSRGGAGGMDTPPGPFHPPLLVGMKRGRDESVMAKRQYIGTSPVEGIYTFPGRVYMPFGVPRGMGDQARQRVQMLGHCQLGPSSGWQGAGGQSRSDGGSLHALQLACRRPATATRSAGQGDDTMVINAFFPAKTPQPPHCSLSVLSLLQPVVAGRWV